MVLVSLLVAVVVAGTLVVLVLAVVQSRNASDDSLHSERVLAQTTTVERLVVDLETGVRGFALTGQPEFLQPWESARRQIGPQTRRLVRLVSDNPSQTRRARRIQAAALSYLNDYSSPLVRMLRTDPASGRTRPATAEGKRRVDGVRRDVQDLTAAESTLLERRAARTRSTAHTAILVGVLAAIGLTLAVLLLAAYLARMIALPVQRVARGAQRVAAGDLATRVPPGGPAELGELADAFNEMTRALEASRSEADAHASELARLSRTSLAQLDAVFGQSPVGLAVWDRELRYVRLNEALARMNGLPVDEHVGKTIPELFPNLDPSVGADLTRALESGEPVLDVQVAGEAPGSPGETRHWHASYFPVRAAGELLGVAAVIVDVTEARRALEQTARLQRLSAALSDALTIDEVAAAVLEEGIGGLGAAGGAVLAAGEPPAEELELVQSHGWERVGPAADAPAAAAWHSQEALYLESPSADHPALAETGHEAWVFLPLCSSGGVQGALALAFATARSFGPGERRFLDAVAAQSANALERARLHERDHQMAKVLEAGLRPDVLPEIPGVELAVHFSAAGEGITVGGDFYDAFAVEGGRWLLVMGDVCGKGPAAARITALARYTLRAEAAHDPDPGRLLAQLNRALRAQEGAELVTVICLLAEPTAEGVAVWGASAGHPLALCLRSDGGVESVGAGGPLLGAMELSDLKVGQATLRPEDNLVLYTDGLTEAHAPQRIIESEELAEYLSPYAARSAQDVVTALAGLAHPEDGGHPRDDVAILVARAEVRVGGPAAAPALTAGPRAGPRPSS